MLEQARTVYLEQVGGNPHMVLPAVTMRAFVDLLDAVQPDVVLEQGCGWSTTVLAREAMARWMPYFAHEANPRWRGIVQQALTGVWPVWGSIPRLVDAAAGRTWAALVDGDKQGRIDVVKALRPYAATGVMLLDDANAGYVRAAMEPLRGGPGVLWDLRAVTEVMRRQATWAALWVGEQVDLDTSLLTDCEPLT